VTEDRESRSKAAAWKGNPNGYRHSPIFWAMMISAPIVWALAILVIARIFHAALS